MGITKTENTLGYKMDKHPVADAIDQIADDIFAGLTKEKKAVVDDIDTADFDTLKAVFDHLSNADGDGRDDLESGRKQQ